MVNKSASADLKATQIVTSQMLRDVEYQAETAPPVLQLSRGRTKRSFNAYRRACERRTGRPAMKDLSVLILRDSFRSRFLFSITLFLRAENPRKPGDQK